MLNAEAAAKPMLCSAMPNQSSPAITARTFLPSPLEENAWLPKEALSRSNTDPFALLSFYTSYHILSTIMLFLPTSSASEHILQLIIFSLQQISIFFLLTPLTFFLTHTYVNDNAEGDKNDGNPKFRVVICVQPNIAFLWNSFKDIAWIFHRIFTLNWAGIA